MPKFRSVYESEDEIPEELRDLDLYHQHPRTGNWELVGFEGVKTDEDARRLEESLRKERAEHKATRERLKQWSALDLDPEEVQSRMDRWDELEAMAQGGDKSKVDEIVQARLKTETAPLQRQLQKLSEENEKLKSDNETLTVRERTRKIHDTIRESAAKAGVTKHALQDALAIGERMFEIRDDDGEIVTRDGVGATPGLKATDWLEEQKAVRPHWWLTPVSEGGGATGSGAAGGGTRNPWSADHWNLTEQGRFVKTHGIEKAQKMAERAGTSVGGGRPIRK